MTPAEIEVMQSLVDALQNCADGEDDVLLTRDALADGRALLSRSPPAVPSDPKP